ncbi:MAG: serine protease [Acidobacteriota bacterium]
MSKTNFVLLLLVVASFANAARSQSVSNLNIRVTIVDQGLNLKNVPKYALDVRKANDASLPAQKVVTSFDGTATLLLPAGDYVVSSAEPVVLENRSFTWERPFKIEPGRDVTVELSNDNAIISASTAPAAPRRRVSEAAELFKSLRNGVVTVEGVLGAGTGFIIDKNGLVLTNQHVISETTEIRVRFDKNTAVKARLIAVDAERDLAVLQINLAAFPTYGVLKIAEANSGEPPLFEGENVFTIGSPLYQEKILTTGIVSKLEDRAIISDINFSTGNSGGPLFNSLGEVVGVTTFNIKGKDGSGLAGIVRIEEGAALIAKSREISASKGTPSGELMPNIPNGTFPVETIKTALGAVNFPTKQYLADVKDYQIKYMTPVYKFYAIEKDRIESLKIRNKRNKQKGAAADMFRDLRYWNEYAGELLPVVDILALPETTATAKSMALSAITNATIGFSTPFDLKYKADFAEMKLFCDGTEVTPLRRNKTEIDRDLQSYYKTKKRYTYAGVYTYPYELFAPGRCREMKLQVFSEENIEQPITSVVPELIKSRVWTDFADFRRESGVTRIADRKP